MTTPPSATLPLSQWSTACASGRTFLFDRLPAGQYTLCAQAPSTAWLNPCEWGLRPPVVTISRAQPSVNLTMVLKKGASVPVRIDDPGQRFAQHEGKTDGAFLLLGVNTDNFGFRPASLASQDSGGRDYRIVVPFDAPAKIVVGSSFYHLSDALGQPLPRTGSTSIPVSIPAGRSPGAIRLVVTGVGK